MKLISLAGLTAAVALCGSARAEGVADCAHTLLQHKTSFQETTFQRFLYFSINETISASDASENYSANVPIDDVLVGLTADRRQEAFKYLYSLAKSDITKYTSTQYETSYLDATNAQIYKACVDAITRRGGPVATARRLGDDTVEVALSYQWVAPSGKAAAYKVKGVSHAPTLAGIGAPGSTLPPQRDDLDIRTIRYRVPRTQAFDFNAETTQTQEVASVHLEPEPLYEIKQITFPREYRVHVGYGGASGPDPCQGFSFNTGSPKDHKDMDKYFLVGNHNEGVFHTDGQYYGYWYTNVKWVSKYQIAGNFCAKYPGGSANGGGADGVITWSERYYVLFKDGNPVDPNLPQEVKDALGLARRAF